MIKFFDGSSKKKSFFKLLRNIFKILLAPKSISFPHLKHILSLLLIPLALDGCSLKFPGYLHQLECGNFCAVKKLPT